MLRNQDSEDMDVFFPDHSTFHLGDVYLDVTKDGVTLKNGKRTVYFPVIRWISLRYVLDDIYEAVHFLEYNRCALLLKHLGGGESILEFRYNDSVPERITIDFEQYQKLKDVNQVLPTLLPDLNIRLPCEFTHQNIEGEIYCSECTPNGPDWE